ncbi:MAG: response regulator transcription factor [Blastocatellia bacterium]
MIDKVTKKSDIRLLLVEDDRDSCEALASLLGSFGYEVRIALTVADGLRGAQENRFDLIILDNWFKEGSGVELCKQIRRFDAETPILFYSAAGYDKDIQDGLKAGAQWYVVKPNFDEFQEVLAQVLKP